MTDDKVVPFVPKLTEAEKRLIGSLVDYPEAWMAALDDETKRAGDIALILAPGDYTTPCTWLIFRAADFTTLWDMVMAWVNDTPWLTDVAQDHFERQIAKALEYTVDNGAYYLKLEGFGDHPSG